MHSFSCGIKLFFQFHPLEIQRIWCSANLCSQALQSFWRNMYISFHNQTFQNQPSRYYPALMIKRSTHSTLAQYKFACVTVARSECITFDVAQTSSPKYIERNTAQCSAFGTFSVCLHTMPILSSPLLFVYRSKIYRFERSTFPKLSFSILAWVFHL